MRPLLALGLLAACEVALPGGGGPGRAEGDLRDPLATPPARAGFARAAGPVAAAAPASTTCDGPTLGGQLIGHSSGAWAVHDDGRFLVTADGALHHLPDGSSVQLDGEVIGVYEARFVSVRGEDLVVHDTLLRTSRRFAETEQLAWLPPARFVGLRGEQIVLADVNSGHTRVLAASRGFRAHWPGSWRDPSRPAAIVTTGEDAWALLVVRADGSSGVAGPMSGRTSALVAGDREGRVVAMETPDSTIQVHDLVGGRLLLEAPARSTIAVDPTGTWVAVAGDGGRLDLLEVATGAVRPISPADATLQDWTQDSASPWSPDGRHLVYRIAGRDSQCTLRDCWGGGQPQCWSIAEWYLLRVADGSSVRLGRGTHAEPTWSDDGSRLVAFASAEQSDRHTCSSSPVGVLRLWDLVTLDPVAELGRGFHARAWGGADGFLLLTEHLALDVVDGAGRRTPVVSSLLTTGTPRNVVGPVWPTARGLVVAEQVSFGDPYRPVPITHWDRSLQRATRLGTGDVQVEPERVLVHHRAGDVTELADVRLWDLATMTERTVLRRTTTHVRLTPHPRWLLAHTEAGELCLLDPDGAGRLIRPGARGVPTRWGVVFEVPASDGVELRVLRWP